MPKKLLRKELKRERAQIAKEIRSSWDQAIFRNLLDWSIYQRAQRVMVYLSFGWEIDTWAIVQDLQERDKEIYVPVVRKSPKGIVATRFTSREDLVLSSFGILEPQPMAPTIASQKLDLVIVPGLVFSSQGYRIGYGGGYYDRFLPTIEACSVGLVYSSFLRMLEPDPWDQAVDYLISEEGVWGRK